MDTQSAREYIYNSIHIKLTLLKNCELLLKENKMFLCRHLSNNCRNHWLIRKDALWWSVFLKLTTFIDIKKNFILIIYC